VRETRWRWGTWIDDPTSAMEVEISQLELRYRGLRIRDAGHRAKLLASVARDGQQSLVTVVASEVADRFVLIDGYARVGVLTKLAQDLVAAVVLEVSEAEALVMSHRLDGQRRRSALEDGWLLEALMEQHGLGLAELATRLDRSRSWISRRLALVTVLPRSAQERVRRGQLGAQVATKYLVPLARANEAQCDVLVKNLNGERPTVREMGGLYDAWRKGDAEQRQRLVESPRLFFKAMEAEEPMTAEAERLLTDLRMLAAVSRRAERRVDEGVYRDASLRERARLRRAWSTTAQSFTSLHASATSQEMTCAGT